MKQFYFKTKLYITDFVTNADGQNYINLQLRFSVCLNRMFYLVTFECQNYLYFSVNEIRYNFMGLIQD